MAVPSSVHKGWARDIPNGTMRALYNGTEVFKFTATTLTVTAAVAFNGAVTYTSTISSTGAYASTLVGNAFTAVTGNVALGNPGAFATTQPQGAVIMGGSSLGGVAPAGAITTAGGIFASDTVVRKIIAAGTVSNVET